MTAAAFPEDRTRCLDAGMTLFAARFPVFTDAGGMTLYMYPNDTHATSTSNCYDACAQRWPALLADANGKFDIKSSDLDAKLFGTTTRKDNTQQITFNGWPLYYWQNDKKPADTLGFGVGDIWWVMTPDGGLRSYASMTYAGLKSMIFAGVGPEDPRVKAAVSWIRKHYDLQSNPGMGTAGLFYYYHTFGKAMTALKRGKGLVLVLVTLQ